MDTIHEDNVIIQSINPDWSHGKVAALDMLRLDLLHPVISGNKWYKLVYNLEYATAGGYKTIVTFGGGFSNHLVAVAHAAKLAGLKVVGIVRGKYDQLTPTLLSCQEEGMELRFETKSDYDLLQSADHEQELLSQYERPLIIPEGGANEMGRNGAGLISKFFDKGYTHIAVSVGSGTTLAGIRNNTSTEQSILGFAPMKGGSYLKDHIFPWLSVGQDTNWHLYDTWHFGGFGKWNAELVGFMNGFYEHNLIPLDVIYTSKMMYGIQSLLADGCFDPLDRVLCVHTGGLQGNAGLKGALLF